MIVAALLPLLLHSLNFVLPLRLMLLGKAKWKAHTPWFFSLGVFFMLTWANPCYHILAGTKKFYGANTAIWMPSVMWIYFWVIGVYNLVYWFFAQANLRFQPFVIPAKWVGINKLVASIRSNPLFLKAWLIIPPYLCLLAQWHDMEQTGVSMLDLYNPFFTDTAYTVWLYEPINPWFQSLGDCLMLWVVAAFVFKTPIWHRVLIVYLAYTLFFLEAWRYRTILTTLGILINYLWTLPNKQLSRGVLLTLLFGYLVLFSTNNRWQIAHREFADITFNPIGIGVQNALVNQTNNCQPDAALLGYLKEGKTEHDWGKSSFLYSIYRFVPAKFFKGGDKGTPPLIHDHKRSINKTGEVTEIGAHTNIMEYWYGFGTLGAIVIMAFWAGVLAKVHLNVNNLQSRLLVISILMLIFQVITRGYSPQHLELAFFLSLPLSGIWLLNPRSELKSIT